MTIWELIKSSNSRKNKTKLKKLMEVKRYYLSMYRCYSVMMYDKGYISDPTRFDKKQITKNIMDMGITDMFTPTGLLDLTSKHTLFAYYKNKTDSDKSEFLSLLYEMLKYKEYSEKIDIVYEEFGFRDEDSALIRIGMCEKGAMVLQKSGIEFDEALARCVTSFDMDIKSVSIRDNLWVAAMDTLGIPKNEQNNSGLFDKKLSHDEEVACMEGILNGFFKVSGGKYASRLEDWLMSHRWGRGSTYKSDMLGLYDYIFSSNVMVVEGYLNNALSALSNVQVLAVHKDSIFYLEPIQSIKMPVGIFSILCDSDNETEKILPNGNILNGYTGELYTLDRLMEDGINYVGCPIFINLSKSNQVMAYDLEQTDIQSDSFFVSSGADITFDASLPDLELEEGTPAFDLAVSNPIVCELLEAYDNSLRDSSNLIITLSTTKWDDFDNSRQDLFNIINKLGEA